MKKEYLIIIGDVDNGHYNEMTKRMLRLGEARKILDNVYILTLGKEDDNNTKETIRTQIAGKDYGYCIVIELRSMKSAWSLTKQNSDLLSSYFNKGENEK